MLTRVALPTTRRRMKTWPEPQRLHYEPLHDLEFPNGKIWWSYPWEADKRLAYIVHANWNKQQKKSRLLRDGLWFLTKDDARCETEHDPMKRGCSKLCYPIAYAAPGGKPNYKSCANLNHDDDYLSRKHGQRWAASNYTKAPNLRGLLYHPMAYEALPNCVRDLSKVVPYAKMLHEKLAKEYWGPAEEQYTQGHFGKSRRFGRAHAGAST